MRPEGEQAIKAQYREATEYLVENEYTDIVPAIRDLAEIVLHECEIAAADLFEDERMVVFGDIRAVLEELVT